MSIAVAACGSRPPTGGGSPRCLLRRGDGGSPRSRGRRDRGRGRRPVLGTSSTTTRITSPTSPQEELAARLVGLAPEMARVRFLSGGSEANETALRLARQYHVDRGDERPVAGSSRLPRLTTEPRWQRFRWSAVPTCRVPFGPYLSEHLHIPPSTERFDPTGKAALEALWTRRLKQAGPENVSAFFCEPVSAASLAGYSRPRPPSGKGWRSGGIATDSSSASTRWSPAWGVRGTGSPIRVCRSPPT